MARKIAKVELKKPDRIHTLLRSIIDYASENSKKIYLLSGIFFLILIVSGGWYFYGLSCEKKAQEMYSSAYSSYKTVNATTDSKKHKDAVNLFEELIKQYPQTNAAQLACYNLGNIYFNLGEIDKSMDAYKQFLNKSSKNNVLTSLAYYGLGYCYEVKKEYANAVKSFDNSSMQGTGKFCLAMNYQSMARVYEEMNKPDKAEEYYKKTLEQTTDPLTERLIKRKISTLNTLVKSK